MVPDSDLALSALGEVAQGLARAPRTLPCVSVNTNAEAHCGFKFPISIGTVADMRVQASDFSH